MAEPIDVFVDAMHIAVMGFGSTLQFAVSKPVPMSGPQPPGSMPLPSDRVATIRMTPEFLKGMAFLLREHVLLYERNSGFKIELPKELMANILSGTSIDRWKRCWELE